MIRVITEELKCQIKVAGVLEREYDGSAELLFSDWEGGRVVLPIAHHCGFEDCALSRLNTRTAAICACLRPLKLIAGPLMCAVWFDGADRCRSGWEHVF